MAGHALNAAPNRPNDTGDTTMPNRMPGTLRYMLAIATAIAVVMFTFTYFVFA